MARSSAHLAGHPIHPMLVVIPLGTWMGALVFDIVHAVTGHAVWGTVAFWNIVVGIVGALAAAVPGFMDYVGMTGRLGRLATWHMFLNLGAVVLFAVNAFIRTRLAEGSPWPLVLSIVGVAGVIASGWLGGEMVYAEKVGVLEQPQARSGRSRRAA